MIKKRDSGIETLRVIAMLMVILIHAFGYGNFYSESLASGGATAELMVMFRLGLRPAVNIFILITGYFMINSDFNLKKSYSRVLNTYSRAWFYSFVLTVIFIILGQEYWLNVSMTTPMPLHKVILRGIFPVTSQMWYYIGNYIILCLFSPFINITLKSINKKQYQILLIILSFLMSVWMTLLNVYPFNLWFSSFSYGSIFNGMSIFSFIYIYIIGGYIGLHFEKREHPKYLYLYLAFACLIVNYLLLSFLDPKSGYKAVATNYSNPFVILQGVFMLLFFKDLHYHSKIINTLASTTLGVYAIHEFTFIRKLLWEDWFNFREMEKFNFLTVLLIAILIFVVLAVVDLAVQKLFKLPSKFKKLKSK